MYINPSDSLSFIDMSAIASNLTGLSMMVDTDTTLKFSPFHLGEGYKELHKSLYIKNGYYLLLIIRMNVINKAKRNKTDSERTY